MVSREDGLTAGEEAQFQIWLQADPAHADAYARMCRLWQDLGRLAPLPPPVPAQIPRPAASNKRRSRWMTRFPWGTAIPQMAAAAFAFAVVGGGLWGFDTWRSMPVFEKTYATLRGQQETVRLPDGSTLWLDTGTQAQVTLYRNRREVRLPEGQARFSVQHDADRPFDVMAGPVRVTVLGTRFSVRYTQTGLHENDVSVAVEQGHVRVAPAGPNETGDSGTRHLAAGQAVVSDAAGALGPVLAATVTDDWREGRVTFDRVLLSQALAELDRYREGKLRIRDPQVAGLLISGSFDLRHLDAFERSLPQVLPVVLRRNGEFTDIVASAR